ncbi:MAG: type IV secretory system conjugative DNA transfer family protein [Eubacteriales bacterium]|nr:type IV secretory system conjugative DNA transfer family protein [Eubacteriales bacterium]
MYVKKKIPWVGLLLLLIPIEIAAYYVSGLFLIPGVTLANYMNHLAYIMLHPFHLWLNAKTPAVMGIGLILWLMGVSYFLSHYKNYQFDKEHGVAEWADVAQMSKELRGESGNDLTYLSQNIAFSSKALSNMNGLVIGGSGSFKTTSVLTPNLLEANCTNIFLDIKGELLRNHGNYLKAHGITVKSFNLKYPLESDRFNPFEYIYSNSDLVALIQNIQESVTPPDAQKGDPFWADGVGLYMQSMFEYEWYMSKNEKRKATMNNILKLVNMESKKVDENGTTALQQEMNRLAEIYGDDYPPVRDYRKLKEGATETVRSIIIMVNAQLRLFELPEIQRIFEDDDIDIPSLGLGVDGNPNKKTALFLVMRSLDNSYNLFINIFYNIMFRVLKDLADNECEGGSLPIHVRLWADEYYAGPKPQNTETLMGEIRGRNLSIVPILQDLAQIKTVFPQDKWQIFNDNCASVIYLGSGPTADDTHKWISDMLGETTIDTRSESIPSSMNQSGSVQNQKGGMKLFTPTQVREMPRKHCIIFLEGRKPIYDVKNIPFNTPKWKESEELAGKYGYRHPVRVTYNEKTRTYKTIECREKIQILDEKDLEYYKEAAKTDNSIRVYEVDAQDFLFLNLHPDEKPTVEELSEMIRNMQKKDVSEMELPADVAAMKAEKAPEKDTVSQKTASTSNDKEEKNVPHDSWDLSGSIIDCMLRYGKQLSHDEMDIIIQGIEDGLTDEQVKKYFALHDVKQMKRVVHLLRIQNKTS